MGRIRSDRKGLGLSFAVVLALVADLRHWPDEVRGRRAAICLFPTILPSADGLGRRVRMTYLSLS